MTTADTRTRRENFIKFIPHEVTLLLQPGQPTGQQEGPLPQMQSSLIPLETVMQDALRAFFSGVGFPLQTGSGAFYNGCGRDRPLIRIVRPGRDPLAMVTVNLADWSPEPFDDAASPHQDSALVIAGLQTVVAAVKKIGGLPSDDPLRTVGDYHVFAATPNWSASSADGCCSGGGGPAGLPIVPSVAPSSVANGHDGFPHFQPSDVLAEVQRRLATLPSVFPAQPPSGFGSGVELGQGVKVAILDTWPADNADDGVSALQAFRDKLQQVSQSTVRLDAFLPGTSTVKIDLTNGFRDLIGANTKLAGSHLHFARAGNVEPPYIQRDHGLFVADIISDIAPGAELRVWRVINDWGFTDTDSIAQAVAEAIDWANGDALVINLSLVLGPELYMLDAILADPTAPYNDGNAWAWKGYQAIEVLNASDPTVLETTLKTTLTDPSWQAILAYLSLDSSPNLLPVAAAGNESTHGNGHIAPPRLPAAIEGVLGVSASDATGNAALYSNADDIEPNRDGAVIAYGGQIDIGSSRTSVHDGMIGLYTYTELPPGTVGGNQYGYAQWCGTSFATAVASGLAAAAWTVAAWDNAAGKVNCGNLPALVIHNPDQSPQCDLFTAMVMLGEPDLAQRAVRLLQT